MTTLILFLALISGNHQNEYKIDFGSETLSDAWLVINDGVMGGLSNSSAIMTYNSLVFEGDISLDNNGGFASVRSPRGTYDLADFSSVTIRYRSEDQVFGLRLLEHEAYYMPYYMQDFMPTSWDWKTITVDLNRFKEYRLGNETGSNISYSSLANIDRMGLIVSNKEEGEFKIEIDYIKFN